MLYVSSTAFVLNAADVTWTPVHAFLGGTLPIPLAVGAGPNGSALYVTLYDRDTTHGRTPRSDDGGQTWQPLDIPSASATPPRRLPPPSQFHSNSNCPCQPERDAAVVLSAGLVLLTFNEVDFGCFPGWLSGQ